MTHTNPRRPIIRVLLGYSGGWFREVAPPWREGARKTRTKHRGRTLRELSRRRAQRTRGTCAESYPAPPATLGGHAPKRQRLPVYERTSLFGISFAMISWNGSPVQCIGITTS